MTKSEMNKSELLLYKEIFRSNIENENSNKTIVWEINDVIYSDKPPRQGFLFRETYGCNFILLNINIYENKPVIYLTFNPKNIKIELQCILYFKFEDAFIIELHNGEYGILSPRKALYKYYISKEVINTFLNKSLESIYIIDNNTNITHFSSALNYPFSAYAYIYKEILKETLNIFSNIPQTIDDAKIKAKEIQLNSINKNETNDIPVIDNSCYVYLMLDKSNNYYKIGESKTPEYRERTLQSEKPCIELLCAKKYTNKTLAHTVEKALHRAFANKRIRGEWFNLSELDVLAIKETLK